MTYILLVTAISGVLIIVGFVLYLVFKVAGPVVLVGWIALEVLTLHLLRNRR